MSRLWDKRKYWSVIGFFPPINKNIALLISSGERAVWQRFRRELLYSSSILHSSPVGRGEGIGGFCFFAIKFTYFLPPPPFQALYYTQDPPDLQSISVIPHFCSVFDDLAVPPDHMVFGGITYDLNPLPNSPTLPGDR